MFHSLAVDDTVPNGVVPPTFDALLIGPDLEDDGDDVDADVDAGNPQAARMYVWRTRAWLPPTKHQPKGNTP